MVIPCPSCGTLNRVPASRLTEKARCRKCKTSLLPLEKPQPVASASDFDELVSQSKLPVLVDFWAAWCGPCRVVAPELEALAREKKGQVVIAKVDTEALPDVAGRFHIASIPTFILFKEGSEAKRVMGAMPRQRLAQEVGL